MIRYTLPQRLFEWGKQLTSELSGLGALMTNIRTALFVRGLTEVVTIVVIMSRKARVHVELYPSQHGMETTFHPMHWCDCVVWYHVHGRSESLYLNCPQYKGVTAK